jgi:hypothetical protein
MVLTSSPASPALGRHATASVHAATFPPSFPPAESPNLNMTVTGLAPSGSKDSYHPDLDVEIDEDEEEIVMRKLKERKEVVAKG